VVEDVQARVLHELRDNIPVTVKSRSPKSRPATVTEIRPQKARFKAAHDRTGASKEYRSKPVALTAPVVTTATLSAIFSWLPRHCTLVAELQDPVVHIAPESIALDVMSYTPKLRPVTVTEDSPLSAPFENPRDTAGASNDITPSPVPAAPTTVTRTVRESPTDDQPAVLKQDTVVALDQADVSHPLSASAELTVRSTEPKSSPATVTELRPLVAEFSPARDPTGASNENTDEPVPATAPTVTASSSADISR